MAILRWVLAAMVGSVLVAAVGAVALERRAAGMLDERFEASPMALDVPDDREAIERGQHLAVELCARCHGFDLGGGVVFDDPKLARIDAPRLAGKAIGTEDLVRAIRHGVRPDGRSLFIMPSRDFAGLSEPDLAALIAWIQEGPRVERATEPMSMTFLGRVLYGAGAFGELRSAVQVGTPGPAPAATPTEAVAFGAYLVAANGCRACHGQDLRGGKDANPKAPPGPDLTDDGPWQLASQSDFVTAMRTGQTPDGRALDPDFMPWPSMGQANDEELAAMWAYLDTL